MELRLPKKLRQYVQEKMATGRYASMEDLVEEALRVMRNIEREVPGAQDDLRRELDSGLADLDAGRVSDWNVEEAKARLLERLKSKKAS